MARTIGKWRLAALVVAVALVVALGACTFAVQRAKGLADDVQAAVPGLRVLGVEAFLFPSPSITARSVSYSAGGGFDAQGSNAKATLGWGFALPWSKPELSVEFESLAAGVSVGSGGLPDLVERLLVELVKMPDGKVSTGALSLATKFWASTKTFAATSAGIERDGGSGSFFVVWDGGSMKARLGADGSVGIAAKDGGLDFSMEGEASGGVLSGGFSGSSEISGSSKSTFDGVAKISRAGFESSGSFDGPGMKKAMVSSRATVGRDGLSIFVEADALEAQARFARDLAMGLAMARSYPLSVSVSVKTPLLMAGKAAVGALKMSGSSGGGAARVGVETSSVDGVFSGTAGIRDKGQGVEAAVSGEGVVSANPVLSALGLPESRSGALGLKISLSSEARNDGLLLSNVSGSVLARLSETSVKGGAIGAAGSVAGLLSGVSESVAKITCATFEARPERGRMSGTFLVAQTPLADFVGYGSADLVSDRIDVGFYGEGNTWPDTGLGSAVSGVRVSGRALSPSVSIDHDGIAKAMGAAALAAATGGASSLVPYSRVLPRELCKAKVSGFSFDPASAKKARPDLAGGLEKAKAAAKGVAGAVSKGLDALSEKMRLGK